MPAETGITHSRVFAFVVLIFVLAFTLRLSLVVLLHNYGVIPPGEMEHVAKSWALTGQLADPYSTPTGPTAHVSPVYPLLLGSVYRIFGVGANGRFAQAVLSCVLSSLRCALLLPLSIALGLGFRIGFLAAALGTVYISAFNTELRGAWEAPLCALILMSLVALAARFYKAPAFTIWTAIGYGVFAGLALLLSPALLPTLIAFLMLTVKLGLRIPKVYACWLIGIVVTAALVLVPWAVRNARVLGSPIVFRSNFGLELSLAFNDSKRTSTLEPGIEESHPFINEVVSREVAQIGEVAFNRNRQRQAMEWIRAHPFTAARLVAVHFTYFWFPPAENVIFRAIFAFLTLFALAGLVAMYKMNQPAGLLIGLIWITFPLIYYLTYWLSRYRYPMEWTLLLCSAALAEQLWWRFGRRKPS